VKNLPRGSALVLVTPSQRSSVESAVDIALSWRLKPILVLFDMASFGGMETYFKYRRDLSIRHVPTILVEYCIDLKNFWKIQGCLIIPIKHEHSELLETKGIPNQLLSFGSSSNACFKT